MEDGRWRMDDRRWKAIALPVSSGFSDGLFFSSGNRLIGVKSTLFVFDLVSVDSPFPNENYPLFNFNKGNRVRMRKFPWLFVKTI